MSPSVIPCTPSGVAPWLFVTALLSVKARALPRARSRGPGHQHRRAVAGPFDREQATVGGDVDLRREDAEADADHGRGAGAGAARERLARAALPDAQARPFARDDLHGAGVDAAREARVLLEQRSLLGDRRAVDVGDEL